MGMAGPCVSTTASTFIAPKHDAQIVLSRIGDAVHWRGPRIEARAFLFSELAVSLSSSLFSLRTAPGSASSTVLAWWVTAKGDRPAGRACSTQRLSSPVDARRYRR